MARNLMPVISALLLVSTPALGAEYEMGNPLGHDGQAELGLVSPLRYEAGVPVGHDRSVSLVAGKGAPYDDPGYTFDDAIGSTAARRSDGARDVARAAPASYANDSTGSDVDVTVVRSRRIQAELNKGKNYADAWGTTSADVLDASERARQHERAMNAGKDHTDARPSSTKDSEAVMANARLHQQAMERGLDHEDARAASHADR